MDSKAYFEKVMQDFNQFREGRSLRKYCSDEGIDYNWVIKYKKEYPGKRNEEENPVAPLGRSYRFQSRRNLSRRSGR